MFQQGSLLYITDFDFSSINTSLNLISQFRNKYIVILDSDKESTTICCFTTTLKNNQNHKVVNKDGCNKAVLPYHVFRFTDGGIVCDDTSYIFPSSTYIAGIKGQVFYHPLADFYQSYRLDGKILCYGTIKEDILLDILACLSSSKALENEFKNAVFAIGDKLMTNIQLRDQPKD